MGGRQVIVGLMKLPELDAGVCYYGLPSPDQGDPRTIRAPLQAHFGNQDPIITPNKVNHLEQLLREGGVPHEIHRYGANHAFANEARPGRYHAEAAETAWRRSIEFLGRTIG
jgi:carboxymethylenebutenolidase